MDRIARTLVPRVTDWRDPDVWRDIELRADQTLDNLHDMIQTAFDLDRDHPYTFFLNNRAWDIAFEYGGPKVTSRFRAEETCLETLPLRVNKRFMYIFDFGDELTYPVKVLAEDVAKEGARYPRIIAEHGEASPQYELHDDYATTVEETPLDPALQELLPMVKKCLEESSRREAEADRGLTGELDSEDAAPDEARVDPAFELDVASRLLDLTEADHDSFHRIGRAVEAALVPWLCELPRLLSDGGRNDAALRLHDRLRPLEWESSPSIFDRPVLLARAGQREAALSELQRNMVEFPDEPEMLLRSGDAYQDLGDLEAAERRWREALKWCGDDRSVRKGVYRRLAPLLDRQGRQRDLEELYRAEIDFVNEMARIRRVGMLGTAYVPTYRRETAKVGRNDPCPCGSGKKFKKCCGSTGTVGAPVHGPSKSERS